jgi:hypothetical protein
MLALVAMVDEPMLRTITNIIATSIELLTSMD